MIYDNVNNRNVVIKLKFSVMDKWLFDLERSSYREVRLCLLSNIVGGVHRSGILGVMGQEACGRRGRWDTQGGGMWNNQGVISQQQKGKKIFCSINNAIFHNR